MRYISMLIRSRSRASGNAIHGAQPDGKGGEGKKWREWVLREERKVEKAI